MWDSLVLSLGLLVKGTTGGTPWAGIPFPPPAIPNHSVTFGWRKLPVCQGESQGQSLAPGEGRGGQLQLCAHSPAGRRLWEHFLGDGTGSMLACKSALTIPSPELPAGGCGAPQPRRELLSMPEALIKRSGTGTPQPQHTKPWGTECIMKCELGHPAA